MGSSDAPEAPDYVGQALATGNSGKYSEVTPQGTVRWTLRPGADPANPQPGDYIRTTELSPEQQALYNNSVENQLAVGQTAGDAIADFNGLDQQSLSDALYRKSTRYYDQNFGDQEEALRTRLLNSGLTEGSQGYDTEMRNFGQQKNTAYADATDRAIAGSEVSANNSVTRLAQLLSMSRGESPASTNSSGGGQVDLLGAANAQYTNALDANNASNAQDSQNMGTVATLATVAYMM